jgi:hypothetical protein
MRTIVAALFVVGLTVSAATAQTFAPKNYPDCVMLHAKKASSRDGGMLMRRACKCRFQDPNRDECKDYSQAALDCLLSNLSTVEHDEEAWGVERACRIKFPAK